MNAKSLLETLSSIRNYINHNVGSLSGSTTAHEVVLAKLAKTIVELEHAIKNELKEGILPLLDRLESELKSAQLTSFEILRADKSGSITQEEVEHIIERLDSIRDEMG